MSKSLQPFVFALIAALAVWSGMMWDRQRAVVDPARLEQVQAALKELTPQELVRSLTQQRQGQPAVLLVYASWCGYCKKYMPDLLATLDEPAFAGVERVFVSVDEDVQKLERFLAARSLRDDFAPILLRQTREHSLGEALRRVGGAYTGSIPYVAWFDARGRLVVQATGGLEPSVLRAALSK